LPRKKQPGRYTMNDESKIDIKMKRRAPSVVGRFAIVIGLVAAANWIFGVLSKSDVTFFAGMATAATLIYFDPPRIRTTHTYSTPQTWRERLGEYF